MLFSFSSSLLYDFFFFLLFNFLSFWSFSVSHSLFLFRSVLSFRLVVLLLILVSPSSLLLSLPCFPLWRILLFSYFVWALQRTCAPCEPEVCIFPLRAVSFFSYCVADVDLYLIFFSSFPFPFRFGHRLFSSCLFPVGTMLSPRFRFLMRLV